MEDKYLGRKLYLIENIIASVDAVQLEDCKKCL